MSFLSARKEAGITQEEAARILSVDQTAVSNWERGKNRPRASLLVEIANTYKCSIETLLSRDDCVEG